VLVLVLVSVLVLVADDGVEPDVLLLLLLEPDAGLAAVLVLFVVLLLLLEPPAGLLAGFTTVVLLVVPPAGDAAGVAVSVFCSQDARSAALARMQMYFVIVFGLSGPCWVNP
jgi:hypothetical protein